MKSSISIRLVLLDITAKYGEQIREEEGGRKGGWRKMKKEEGGGRRKEEESRALDRHWSSRKYGRGCWTQNSGVHRAPVFPKSASTSSAGRGSQGLACTGICQRTLSDPSYHTSPDVSWSLQEVQQGRRTTSHVWYMIIGQWDDDGWELWY